VDLRNLTNAKIGPHLALNSGKNDSKKGPIFDLVSSNLFKNGWINKSRAEFS
jgi:hypothetical protein